VHAMRGRQPLNFLLTAVASRMLPAHYFVVSMSAGHRVQTSNCAVTAFPFVIPRSSVLLSLLWRCVATTFQPTHSRPSAKRSMLFSDHAM
jgi:hypothetical protein